MATWPGARQYNMDSKTNMDPASLWITSNTIDYCDPKDIPRPNEADVALIFGNEDKGLTGLPESALRWPSVYIPMAPEIRSYNLANSVNVVLWEAFRQRHKQGGPGA